MNQFRWDPFPGRPGVADYLVSFALITELSRECKFHSTQTESFQRQNPQFVSFYRVPNLLSILYFALATTEFLYVTSTHSRVTLLLNREGS